MKKKNMQKMLNFQYKSETFHLWRNEIPDENLNLKYIKTFSKRNSAYIFYKNL